MSGRSAVASAGTMSLLGVTAMRPRRMRAAAAAEALRLADVAIERDRLG